MTRKEMVEFFYENCNSRSCNDCPMVSENCDVGSMNDKELIKAVEILTNGESNEKEKTVELGCDSAPCEKERKPIHMVTISRDEMRMMEGRLLMLASCTGATISNAMADEILFMVDAIERALSYDEGAVG